MWRPTIEPIITVVFGIQSVNQAMQRCAILIQPTNKNIMYGGENKVYVDFPYSRHSFYKITVFTDSIMEFDPS